ncbi:MAG: hypothetical protein MUO67_12190 [Anaerolineales bacterium]|jgi:hypothetical protein|nr:hypothetical protein [Anaerolineales bacterium]
MEMGRLDNIKAKLNTGDALKYDDLAWLQDQRNYDLIAQFYERDIRDPMAFLPEKVKETIVYWYLAGAPERAIQATKGIWVSDTGLMCEIIACQAVAYLQMGDNEAAKQCAVEIQKLNQESNLAREVIRACALQAINEMRSQYDDSNPGEWLEMYDEEPELRDWHNDPADFDWFTSLDEGEQEYHDYGLWWNDYLDETGFWDGFG